MTWRRSAGVVVAAAALLCACRSQTKSENPPPISRTTATATSALPPLPVGSSSPLGADSPPTVWVGGTLTDVTGTSIRVMETQGPVVVLRRLARGATGFFRAEAGSWQRLPDGTPVGTSQPACVETLMAGANLLALRVFLGATCGPT